MGQTQDVFGNIPSTSPITPPAGEVLTGGISGGELSYVSTTDFQVSPFSCYDSTGLVPLAKDTATNVNLGTPLINTIYNVFAIDIAGVYGVEVDTDVNGGGLPANNGFRWLGFVLTDAAGAIVQFYMESDIYNYTVDIGDGLTPGIAMPPERVDAVAIDTWEGLSTLAKVAAVSGTALIVNTVDLKR